jgi:hypothetical protein
MKIMAKGKFMEKEIDEYEKNEKKMEEKLLIIDKKIVKMNSEDVYLEPLQVLQKMITARLKNHQSRTAELRSYF